MAGGFKARPSVREVIVVEGRYDKNVVAQAVDASIIETSGFGIFSDGEKLALLRRLAETRGLIILTDSDGAGFFIRGRLRGMFSDVNVKHAYIPDIPGKERRKTARSKEGKLGVEGMSGDIIVEALARAGAAFGNGENGGIPRGGITKADFYDSGLTGSGGSREKRAELLQLLKLPRRLSANGLLDVVNILYSRDEFLRIADGISRT